MSASKLKSPSPIHYENCFQTLWCEVVPSKTKKTSKQRKLRNSWWHRVSPKQKSLFWLPVFVWYDGIIKRNKTTHNCIISSSNRGGHKCVWFLEAGLKIVFNMTKWQGITRNLKNVSHDPPASFFPWVLFLYFR